MGCRRCCQCRCRCYGKQLLLLVTCRVALTVLLPPFPTATPTCCTCRPVTRPDQHLRTHLSCTASSTGGPPLSGPAYGRYSRHGAGSQRQCEIEPAGCRRLKEVTSPQDSLNIGAGQQLLSLLHSIGYLIISTRLLTPLCCSRLAAERGWFPAAPTMHAVAAAASAAILMTAAARPTGLGPIVPRNRSGRKEMLLSDLLE